MCMLFSGVTTQPIPPCSWRGSVAHVFRPMMAGYTRLVGQRVAQIGGARCCWRRATRNIFVL